MRYAIGIDLGTTNCAVAYVDIQQPAGPINLLNIPQLVQAGFLQSRPLLPSFCFLAKEEQWRQEEIALPWKTHSKLFVGEFAKQFGAKQPAGLVRSAKSWLCHSRINREDPILPAEAPSGFPRISPLQATVEYLEHIKQAWNHTLGKTPETEFTEQQIVITVPASFDEAARSLTAEAAKKAGYRQITLLEEPQAAFYSWIARNENSLEASMQPKEQILVCDIGGGTTDFSLIEVVEVEGIKQFRRQYVGDHLLLGGDNMDICLRNLAEERLGRELTLVQKLQLLHAVREAKEKLLSGEESCRIVIQGSGASLVGGSLTVQLTKEDCQKSLVERFFPSLSFEDALQPIPSPSLQSLGLPFEEETAIPKHLAAFLRSAHCEGVDYILFNGGAMKAVVFQQAIVESLRRWFPDKQLRILESASLDLAVARGAGYFGKAKLGAAKRILGGSARSLYLKIATKEMEDQALTLMPRGALDGSVFEPDMTFHLKPNVPVEFQLYSSHTRLTDEPGDLIPIDPLTMHRLPALHTVMRFGKTGGEERVPVRMRATLSDIGTVQLQLASTKTEHVWQLEFQMRQAGGAETVVKSSPIADESFSLELVRQAQELLLSAFSPAGLGPSLDKIYDALEALVKQTRREWPPSLLRALFDALMKQEAGRKISPRHELRFWNLIGFFLRPGTGYPLDDHRLKELWKLLLGELSAPPKSQELLIAYCIAIRRVAAGLNRGQQTQVLSYLSSHLKLRSGKIEVKGKNSLYCYSEKIRTLGALEWLDMSNKTKWGEALVKRLAAGEGDKADIWALCRIGARHPVYAALPQVVSKEVCTRWLKTLMHAPLVNVNTLAPIAENLGRMTASEEVNLDRSFIDVLLAKLETAADYSRIKQVMTEVAQLTRKEQESVLGDSLPTGLNLE